MAILIKYLLGGTTVSAHQSKSSSFSEKTSIKEIRNADRIMRNLIKVTDLNKFISLQQIQKSFLKV